MCKSQVSRAADLHLRGVDRLVPARVYWPSHRVTTPALVVHVGPLDDAAKICRDGHIVLAVDVAVEEAQRAIEWAAVHGAKLGASDCLLAAGPGAVDAVRRARRDQGPPIGLLSRSADSDIRKKCGRGTGP